MSDAERQTLLNAISEAIKFANKMIEVGWGTLLDRQANPTAALRLADAGSLLERAGQKVRKASELYRKAEAKS